MIYMTNRKTKLFFGNWIFDRYYHIFNIDIIYVNPCFQSMKFTFSTINSLKFWHWFSWYIYLLYFFFFLAIIFWKASIKIYVYSSIFPLFFFFIIIWMISIFPIVPLFFTIRFDRFIVTIILHPKVFFISSFNFKLNILKILEGSNYFYH